MQEKMSSGSERSSGLQARKEMSSGSERALVVGGQRGEVRNSLLLLQLFLAD
jgi:hypothetical protein